MLGETVDKAFEPAKRALRSGVPAQEQRSTDTGGVAEFEELEASLRAVELRVGVRGPGPGGIDLPYLERRAYNAVKTPEKGAQHEA